MGRKRGRNKAKNNKEKKAVNSVVNMPQQEKKQDCVSVIVPIYQVEAYLKRAVDSILNQTYRNLEVILVDDGSEDQCGKICDQYAKSDDRVVVIHKKNGGLSDARNAGLDRAKGDYIAFVDSDDYIAPDFIETLLSALKKESADVAMCSYAVTDSTGYDADVFSPSDGRHEADGSVEICDREQLLTNLYDANHRDATYFIVSWNKLYKASLWRTIRFPKGKIHEDEATTYRIYDAAKKGVYLHKPMYGYFSAPGSITRAKFSLKRLDWLDALDGRIAYFEQREIAAGGEAEKGIYRSQLRFAERARADAAIHYYYPLKEELPQKKEEARRLKAYVRDQWSKEKRPGYLIFSFSAPLYRLITNVDRDRKERLYQLAFLLLFAWLAFLCFYKLDVKYVDPWDEARHGVNAYEMLEQKNLIKSTYLYQTDYYNLKPPLSMWAIMLSMLIAGKTVFALRLPSVLCYLLLALVAACFARRRYGRISSLFVLAFLSANTTPFLAHMVRAGDADSLYVLLFSSAMLLMLQIRDNHKKLYGCGFLFALAFLTKSFHAGIIAVIGGLFLLLTGELKKIKIKEYLVFILSFVLPVLIWGGLRYRTDDTAFMEKMWTTDVLGRSQSGFGSNEAGFSYYFSYFLGNMSQKLQIYTVVLICIAAGGLLLLAAEFIRQDKKPAAALKSVLSNRDVIGFFLWIMIPALAFSAIRTKLLWYQYPAVTALLIAGAVVLGRVAESKELHVVFRGIAVLCAVAIAVYFSRDLYLTFEGYGVNGAQTNDFQLLIRDTAANLKTRSVVEGERAELKLCCVYRALETEEWEKEESSAETVDSDWAQQDVFVSEAYGDYYCVDGGVEKLLSDMLIEYKPGISVEYILFTTQTLYDYYQDVISLVGLDEMGYEMVPITSRGEYMAVKVEKRE